MYEHQDLQKALTDSIPDWHGRTARIHRNPGPPVTVCVFGKPTPRVLIYYDRRRLSADAADSMLRHFITGLHGLAAGLDGPVAAVPLLSPAEIHQLTTAWAGADRPAPAAATIGGYLTTQVRRTPDAVAVTGRDGTLSYTELDERANRLAHLLIRRGVMRDTPVAVALPRSVQLVVALLAVIKAGGAYLPLDPGDPPARIRELLAASGDPVTLTDGDHPALPAGHPTVRLDLIAPELPELPTTAPIGRTHPDSLAYVSHTSGSTGAAKGVAVPHRAVLRLIHEPGYLHLGPGETVLQLAPVAFDAATLELWGSLLNGARLVVAPPGPLGPAEIAALLPAERAGALRPGGRVALLEPLAEVTERPPGVADAFVRAFSLNLFHIQGGRAYRFDELAKLLSDAGFADPVEQMLIRSDADHLILATRPA